MDKFVAVINGQRIISVRAENETEAIAEIREQLSRPGRYETFAKWSQTGMEVIKEEA